MASRTAFPLPPPYHDDETAWLEAMALLVAERRLDALDLDRLGEYLSDLARRDRREVYSRLVVLLAHPLEWDRRPDKRSNSWRGTILEQRRELRLLLESGTLRRHAVEVLPEAYRDTRDQAAAETGLPAETFPAECHASIDGPIAAGPGPVAD